jgi:hypothetical protein
MLEHLIAMNFEAEVDDLAGPAVPLTKATPQEVVSAQSNTAEWLSKFGNKPADEVVSHIEQQDARKAFSALTTSTNPEEIKGQLLQLQTPPAVRHLVGMLTAYDWEFVQQAKQLRGYAMAKLLEEVENPNANIRLKALGLLGKVTEVGLFTDKIEVKKTDLTEDEIEAKLKEKLAKFIGVQDADIVDAEEVEQEDERPADQS